MTVFDIIEEPLVIHRIGDARLRREMVEELIGLVGLELPPFAALSAQLFRRPAPAHRNCPRPGAAPGSGDLRRADLGPRRFDPGADLELIAGPEGEARADLSVHFAQSGGRRLYRRPHRGDVRRPDRRNRRSSDLVPQSGASLHPGLARRRADARPVAPPRYPSSDGGSGVEPGELARAVPPASPMPRRGSSRWRQAIWSTRGTYRSNEWRAPRVAPAPEAGSGRAQSGRTGVRGRRARTRRHGRRIGRGRAAACLCSGSSSEAFRELQSAKRVCCQPFPRGYRDRTATERRLGVSLGQWKAESVLALYRSSNTQRLRYMNWLQTTMKILGY